MLRIRINIVKCSDRTNRNDVRENAFSDCKRHVCLPFVILWLKKRRKKSLILYGSSSHPDVSFVDLGKYFRKEQFNQRPFPFANSGPGRDWRTYNNSSYSRRKIRRARVEIQIFLLPLGHRRVRHTV